MQTNTSRRVLVAANLMPMLMATESGVQKVAAGLTLFRIGDDGRLEFVRKVDIDTGKGLDLPHAPTISEVKHKLEQEIIDLASREVPTERLVDAAAEYGRAQLIHNEANLIVRSILQDVRLGKQVQQAIKAGFTGLPATFGCGTSSGNLILQGGK